MTPLDLRGWRKRMALTAAMRGRLSQEAAARILGVAPRTYKAYEAGRRDRRRLAPIPRAIAWAAWGVEFAVRLNREPPWPLDPPAPADLAKIADLLDPQPTGRPRTRRV